MTVDILLDDGFTAGRFQTPDGPDGGWVPHRFELGDALVFPSEKYHGVGGVGEGCRQVLVVEFWDGVERQCNHRCQEKAGPCTFKPSDLVWNPPLENAYFD